MNELPITFLYRPSILLEAVLAIAILRCLFVPRYLTALVAIILLLRPNERFECLVQYPMLLLCMLALVFFLKGGSFRQIWERIEDRKLLLFIGWIMILTLLSYRGALSRNVMFIATGLLLYLAIITFMDDEDGIRIIGRAVVVGCLLICLEPMYYHFMEPKESEVWRRFHWADRLQAWGMWANANETAFIACLGTANMLALAVRFRRRLLSLVSVAVILFFALAVVLTGSRAGLGSLVLIFLPFIYMIRSKGAKLLIAATIAGVFLVAHSMAPERLDKEASSQDRFDLRYLGVQLIKDRPVRGVGFLSAVHETGEPLHNTYIQAFAETGVIGGCLLLSYLFGIGRGLYRCYHEGKSSNPIIAANAGLFLASIFYFYWGNQLLTVLFFLIMSQLRIATICDEVSVKRLDQQIDEPVPRCL